MPHVELPQAEFKVVMLGDTNTGKTSLVLRFAEGYYRDEGRSATVGAFFITKRIQTSNGITCKVQIWDTAGQAQFRKMAPMYYKTAAAAIVCYDVTNPKSYTVMRDWLNELQQNVPVGSIVIAIVATKSDLAYEADPGTLVSAADAEELASNLGAIFVDTSAKTNSNVNLLFQRVSERVLQFREQSKSYYGYNRESSIPVTPGASVDENGKVFKSGIVSPNSDGTAVVHIASRSVATDLGDKQENKHERTVSISEVPEDPSSEKSYICGGPFMECGSSEGRTSESSRCTIS